MVNCEQRLEELLNKGYTQYTDNDIEEIKALLAELSSQNNETPGKGIILPQVGADLKITYYEGPADTLYRITTESTNPSQPLSGHGIVHGTFDGELLVPYIGQLSLYDPTLAGVVLFQDKKQIDLKEQGESRGFITLVAASDLDKTKFVGYLRFIKP